MCWHLDGCMRLWQGEGAALRVPAGLLVQLHVIHLCQARILNQHLDRSCILAAAVSCPLGDEGGGGVWGAAAPAAALAAAGCTDGLDSHVCLCLVWIQKWFLHCTTAARCQRDARRPCMHHRDGRAPWSSGVVPHQMQQLGQSPPRSCRLGVSVAFTYAPCSPASSPGAHRRILDSIPDLFFRWALSGVLRARVGTLAGAKAKNPQQLGPGEGSLTCLGIGPTQPRTVAMVWV